MSMHDGDVIWRRSQGVMSYDVKFHNDLSERIWKEVDVAWLSYYSSICMNGLRKPQMTSFVSDLRFDCPTVFCIEGMVCKYVTDFDVSTGPFSGQRSSQILHVVWVGWTNTTSVSAQTDGNTRTHAHIFMPVRYVRSSHSHDYEDFPTFRKRNFRKFLPEDNNLNFQHKFLCIFTSVCMISVHSRRSRTALRHTQSYTQ
jgi:hypothetical protein